MELVKQPFIYWSTAKLNYDVTAISVSEDRSNLIIGSLDGNIISWNFIDVVKPFPSYIISNQSKSCIKCIETFSEEEGHFFVVAQENGEILLFDADDGHTIQCLNSYKGYFDIKVNKQLCVSSSSEGGTNSKLHFKSYLYCTGALTDIIVLEAMTLNTVFKLGSRFTPDWISSLCFLYNNTTFLDVIIGITMTGCVKLWTLTKENTMETGKYIYENEGKSTGLLNCHTLTYCRQNPKIFIMITSKILQVYNVASFTKLCFLDCNVGEPWVGGCFIGKEFILAWTETIKAYLFHLLEPDDSTPGTKHSLKLKTIFQPANENTKVCFTKPKYNLKKLNQQGKTFSALFCASGDEIYVWDVDCAFEKLQENDPVNVQLPISHISLGEIWPTINSNAGALALDANLIKIAGQDCSVTSSLYLRFHDYYVYGTSHGSINILQRASIGLLESFANYLSEFSKCQSLIHHEGPVTCLLYPHSENPNYDSSYFLSGGGDGDICLWELNTFSLLHVFAPQQASISSLTIVLDINTNKVDNLILSISEDKSVAVINLSQRKCVMMASEHCAPVDYVIWLHFKGFMLVGCIDGSLYVWEIASGMLDRCASGVSSELLYSKLVDKTLWPNVPKTMHNNRRFVRDMGNAITQDISDALFKHPPFQYPLRLVPLQLAKPTNSYQIAIYNLVYFSKILCEPDYSRYSTPNIRSENSFDFGNDLINTNLPLSNGTYKTSSPAQRMSLRALSLAGTDVNQLYYNASPPARKRSKMIHEKRILHLILCHNHPWHQDKSIDSKLHDYFEIQPIHNTVPSFCLMAINGNTVSRLSTSSLKTDEVGPLERIERLMRLLIIINTLEKNVEDERSKDGTLASDNKPSEPTKIKEEQNGYNDLHRKKVMDKKQFNQLKRFYLNYFLSPTVGQDKILLDVVVSKLQATCPQVRRAAQEIITYVLTTHYGDKSNGSSSAENELIMNGLVEKAIKCLTFLLDQIAMAHSHPQMAAGQANANQMVIPTSTQTTLTPGSAGISKRFMHRRGSTYKISPFFKPAQGNGNKPNTPSKTSSPEPQPDHGKEREISMKVETENGLIASDDGVFGTSFCERYNFYGCYPSPLLALLLLGFMSSKMHEKPRSQTDQIFKERFGKYFTLQNPRLPVLLSNLLSYLVTAPMVLQASPRPYGSATCEISSTHHQDLSDILLHYENNNVARVIAMRVLSDAFQTFEPFLDLSSILMRLLDICYLANQVALGEDSDESLAEIAKNCLTKIAFLRPAVFITILNKEINKQMMQANIAPLQNLNITNQINALSSGLISQSSSVIVNAREIIYNIIESLISHRPMEILNLLSEALDIYVYCGGAFGKVKDWDKLLAPFIRFPQIAFNAEHKLVAVGTQKGQLLVYDFKTIKPEVYATCHKDAIVAVSFSPDSKYLATFSYPEGVLVLWQMSSSLFGIGSSQAKYMKSRKLDNVPRISFSGEQEFKVGKIVWINLKVILILFADGTEHKLHL